MWTRDTVPGCPGPECPGLPSPAPMIDLHLLPHLCLAGLVAGRARWYFWPVQTSLYFKIHIPSALAAGRRAAAPGREQECVLGRNAGLSYPPASAQTTQYSTVQHSTGQYSDHGQVAAGEAADVQRQVPAAHHRGLHPAGPLPPRPGGQHRLGTLRQE